MFQGCLAQDGMNEATFLQDFPLLQRSKFSREFYGFLVRQQSLARYLARNSLENFKTSVQKTFCREENWLLRAPNRPHFMQASCRLHVGFVQACESINPFIHRTFQQNHVGMQAVLCFSDFFRHYRPTIQPYIHKVVWMDWTIMHVEKSALDCFSPFLAFMSQGFQACKTILAA